jgi:hypothetical protein
LIQVQLATDFPAPRVTDGKVRAASGRRRNRGRHDGRSSGALGRPHSAESFDHTLRSAARPLSADWSDSTRFACCVCGYVCICV